MAVAVVIVAVVAAAAVVGAGKRVCLIDSKALLLGKPKGIGASPIPCLFAVSSLFQPFNWHQIAIDFPHLIGNINMLLQVMIGMKLRRSTHFQGGIYEGFDLSILGAHPGLMPVL